MCYQTRQIRTIKDLELRYNVTLSNPSYGPLFNEPLVSFKWFRTPKYAHYSTTKTYSFGSWNLGNCS